MKKDRILFLISRQVRAYIRFQLIYFIFGPFLPFIASRFPELVGKIFELPKKYAGEASYFFIALDVVLGVNFFNLLTIPGLDGGKIIHEILGRGLLGFPIPFMAGFYWCFLSVLSASIAFRIVKKLSHDTSLQDTQSDMDC